MCLFELFLSDHLYIHVLLLQEVHERQKKIDVEGFMSEEMFKSKKNIYDGYLMLITNMVITICPFRSLTNW